MKKNQEISPRKFINVFNDVKFIPLSSFSSDKRRSESNSRDKDNNRTLNKIRRNKYHRLIEQNNKIIFNKNLSKRKRILNIENTYAKI